MLLFSIIGSYGSSSGIVFAQEVVDAPEKEVRLFKRPYPSPKSKRRNCDRTYGVSVKKVEPTRVRRREERPLSIS